MPYVTDTHSLVWYMLNDPKLPSRVKNIFRLADNSEEQIIIPCIVLFELLYLCEKGKISADFRGFLDILSSAKNYIVEPLCIPIISKAQEIPRRIVSDPWDRLIVATSLHLSTPLITRDESLTSSDIPGLRVVWN